MVGIMNNNRMGYAIKTSIEVTLRMNDLEGDVEKIEFDSEVDLNEMAILITIVKPAVSRFPTIAGNVLGHAFYITMKSDNYMRIMEVLDDLFIKNMPNLTEEWGGKQ